MKLVVFPTVAATVAADGFAAKCAVAYRNWEVEFYGGVVAGSGFAILLL